jgi:class 3 adenylate cyclase
MNRRVLFRERQEEGTTLTPDPYLVRVVAELSDASLATDGERKMVTALFADIKGSTELMRDLDPEEARARLAALVPHPTHRAASSRKT